MSKYTITIEEYCQRVFLGLTLERNPDADPIDTIENMTDDDYYNIVESYIFPSHYDFYSDNPAVKRRFIEDFTNFFLYFEIGQDSIPHFRRTLKKWLNTEMEYFRQLYNSRVANIDEVKNNVDIVRTIAGTLSGKSGTVTRDGSTTYGRKETRNGSGSESSTVNYGKKDYTNIIPLGESTPRPLSEQDQGGADGNTGSHNSSDTLQNSGADSHTDVETYDTLDHQDLTETRKGREGVDLAEAVEKFRRLIIDINSEIFKNMKKYGLFMLVW